MIVDNMGEKQHKKTDFDKHLTDTATGRGRSKRARDAS